MYDDFIQAKNFTIANRTKIDLVIVHTMEAPEKPLTARGVAKWFAGQVGVAPRASAHICVDNKELIGCVRPEHIAWAAPGANKIGYQIEHAGYARQKPEEWADEYSEAMLQLSAKHAAHICRSYDIPAVRLTPDEVKAGKRGICGHVDVNKAFGKSTHTDPGKFFPWHRYIYLVRTELEQLSTGEELDARDARDGVVT